MTFFKELRCIRCGLPYHDPYFLDGCPSCATEKSKSNFTCDYDYEEIKRKFSLELIHNRPRNLWRWQEFLPTDPDQAVTLHEGETPLIHCRALGAAWGVEALYVKDETRNPTWSYKDRLCTVAVSAAREQGAKVITASSTGNHGAAAAAYAAKAGMPCVIFTVASVPITQKTLMQSFGAYVVALPSLEARWRIMREAVQKLGWYPVSNGTFPPVGSSPFGVEGYKTIAFEIADAFDWQVPDHIVCPVAFGDGFYGTWKGFKELKQLGLTNSSPQMTAAQPFGPLENALSRGLAEQEPVPAGKTVAYSIGANLSTHQALAAIKESNGDAFTVNDDKTMSAQIALAQTEGIFAEASSTTALAAVKIGLETGRISPKERICVIISSTGLKDPGATAERLPPVPEAEPTLEKVLATLKSVYGFEFV